MSSSRLFQLASKAALSQPSLASNTMMRMNHRLTTTSSTRCFSQHVRAQVSKEERKALRAARRERAAQILQAQQQQGGAAASSSSSAGSSSSTIFANKYTWYAAVGIPSALLIWGFSDENSPPAKVAEFIGLTGLIHSFSEDFAKPTYDKLLPDWSQVRMVYLQ